MEAHNPVIGRQKILNNHRDIQPLLERPVYVSFNVSESITPDSMKLHTNGTSIIGRTLGEYWNKVHAIKGTVAQAYRRLAEARQNFLMSIG